MSGILFYPSIKSAFASLPAGRERIDAAFADGWLEVRPLADSMKAAAYERRVDPGEAEAIALAEELRADQIAHRRPARTRTRP